MRSRSRWYWPLGAGAARTMVKDHCSWQRDGDDTGVSVLGHTPQRDESQWLGACGAVGRRTEGWAPERQHMPSVYCSKPTALPMLCLMKPRAPCMCRQATVDRMPGQSAIKRVRKSARGLKCLRDKRVMNESNAREHLDETCAIQNSSLYGLVLAHGLITSGRRVGSHGRTPVERLQDRAKPSIRHSAPTPRYEWCR